VRHHQIDFASGALVFPGGKVDPGDHLVRERCSGADDDDIKMSLQVAAIREAFEECGILLARPAGESSIVDAERLKVLEKYRDPLNKDELTIGEFLEAEDLTLACDMLSPFAHWITPEMMPKRFDTWFYLAAAPSDHVAIHDGHESVDSIWISPNDAVEGAKSGKYTIIFPTLLNLQMLAESKTVNEAMTMAGARNIVTVLPWTEQRDDGNWLCIPAEAGYGIWEQKMPDPR
ncbi:MAG: NUDIX hydrolase, partial [Pseudomonadales bacterium]|nr:NUDIX hydrolase [Pseudomonadales bacterium]